jgi:hypothetical protein
MPGQAKFIYCANAAISNFLDKVEEGSTKQVFYGKKSMKFFSEN